MYCIGKDNKLKSRTNEYSYDIEGSRHLARFGELGFVSWLAAINLGSKSNLQHASLSLNHLVLI